MPSKREQRRRAAAVYEALKPIRHETAEPLEREADALDHWRHDDLPPLAPDDGE
jgi:hypothetical protein